MRKMFIVLFLSLLIWGLAGPTWAVGLDVQEVYIDQYKDHWNGTVETNPFGIDIWVNGSGITSLSVVDPHLVSHGLVLDDGEWAFYQGDFADLASLAISYGPGDYVFTFNSGEVDEDTVTISYLYSEPTGFANITNPTDVETGVGLNPTYSWDSAAGYGDALGMWVVDNLSNDIYWNAPADINLTSWQPGVLAASTEYEFEISVITADGGAPQAKQTDGADAFDYYGLFEYINIVGFTTIPEPVSLLVLCIAGPMLFYRRRRK